MAAGMMLPGLGTPLQQGAPMLPQRPPMAPPVPGMMPPALMGQPAPGMMPPPGMPIPGMMPPPMPAPMPDPEPEVSIPEEEWPELYSKLKGWYRDDLEHWNPWREEARKDFQFVAGDQWDDETKRLLQSQQRPAMTFNTIGAMIKSVSGYEVANRQEPRFIQRNMGAAGISELTTAGARYFRDNTDAEHHESAMFRDAAVCGIGCTETYIDYDDNEDGDFRKRRVSVFEMVPDSAARDDNLKDAKRISRVRKMRVSDAADMFLAEGSGLIKADLHAPWADDDVVGTPLHDERPDPYAIGDDEYPDTRDISVVECQWYAFEPYMRFVDPFTGQQTRLPKAEFEALSQKLLAMKYPAPRATTQRRKVWYRAFLGRKVLSVSGTPVQKHFTYAFVTGERDEVKGTFYGIVKGLRDPQSFLNKTISTISHIMATNAKGGIIAEEGVFENPRKAREDWAKPDSIVYTRPGALSNDNGAKLQPKPQGQVNPAYFQLVEFALGMSPKIAGLNAEFLGQQTTDQAGVLEYQRRQSSVTILATLFDNLKLYRTEDGRYTLRLMQEYLSDGRLIRIVGEEGQRFLPLNRDATVGEYEVIVDDAPTSPNMKEQQWATIQAMMPILQPIVGGNPEAIAELMKDAPLAESRKAKLTEILQRKDPQAEAQKQAMQAEAMQAQKAMAYAKINSEDAKAEKSRADALKTLAETVTPFLQVPPVLEGPFPVGPLAPQMPGLPPGGMPRMPGPPQGAPPNPPPMPQGGPQTTMRPPGLPGIPMAPPQPLQGAPGAPPVPMPPGLRPPGM